VRNAVHKSNCGGADEPAEADAAEAGTIERLITHALGNVEKRKSAERNGLHVAYCSLPNSLTASARLHFEELLRLFRFAYIEFALKTVKTDGEVPLPVFVKSVEVSSRMPVSDATAAQNHNCEM